MRGAPGSPKGHQVVLDHVSSEGPSVTRVRGTLLAASLQVVKDEHLYERYLAELPKEYEEAILYSVASSWLPVEVVLAHYLTLDRLGVADAAIEKNGARVGEQLGKTFMATVLRVGRSAGLAQPAWSLLKYTDRVWDRVYAGGGCRVLQVGPKDAIMEFRGLPLAESHYYRVAHIANLRGLTALFSQKSYVRKTRPTDAHPDSLALSLSWV